MTTGGTSRRLDDPDPRVDDSAGRAGAGASGVVVPGSSDRAGWAHPGHRSMAASRAARRQPSSPAPPDPAAGDIGRPPIAVAWPLAMASSPAASSATRAARANADGPSQCSSTQPVDSSAVGEGRAAGHEPVERQGRLDAADLGLVERPAETGDRRSAVPGVDQDLGDQVVVLGGTRSPASIPVSTRTPGPAGMTQRRTRPGVGAKSRDGSSAAIRTSIACPVGSAARVGGGERTRPTAAARPPARTARGRCRAPTPAR